MTYLGPLIITFAPPLSCTSSTGIYITSYGFSCSFYAKCPFSPAFSCFLTSFNPTTSNYYSPLSAP